MYSLFFNSPLKSPLRVEKYCNFIFSPSLNPSSSIFIISSIFFKDMSKLFSDLGIRKESYSFNNSTNFLFFFLQLILIFLIVPSGFWISISFSDIFSIKLAILSIISYLCGIYQSKLISINLPYFLNNILHF